MRSHLKIYFDFEQNAEALTDDEKGRLLLALVRYAKTGTVPEMTGNERFLFPALRGQIDRDIETYETKLTNGNWGGRPRKEQEPEETEENRNKPEETGNNLTEPDITETAKKEERRKKKEDKRNINSVGRFSPPTIEQVREYCRERGNGVNPDRWYNYYSANGWHVGKNPMKDWRAAVRTWENNETNRQQTKPGQPLERDYSGTEPTLSDVLAVIQGDMRA